MSKKVVWDNPENELLDIVVDRTAPIEFIDDMEEETPETSEKDYITRNGKKYYKTEKKYVYKCEDGYYSYRIYHKPSKTNSFVNKDIETGERFNTAHKAEKALERHIQKLEKNKTYKNRNIFESKERQHTKGKLSLPFTLLQSISELCFCVRSYLRFHKISMLILDLFRRNMTYYISRRNCKVCRQHFKINIAILILKENERSKTK